MKLKKIRNFHSHRPTVSTFKTLFKMNLLLPINLLNLCIISNARMLDGGKKFLKQTLNTGSKKDLQNAKIGMDHLKNQNGSLPTPFVIARNKFFKGTNPMGRNTIEIGWSTLQPVGIYIVSSANYFLLLLPVWQSKVFRTGVIRQPAFKVTKIPKNTEKVLYHL